MAMSDNTRLCATLVVTMLVVAMLGALAVQTLIARMLPPPLAMIDVTRTLQRHQQSTAARLAHADSPEERQRQLRRAEAFGATLAHAIATVREECRCTLVLREAIVAGDVPDLTPRLAALLDAR